MSKRRSASQSVDAERPPAKPPRATSIWALVPQRPVTRTTPPRAAAPRPPSIWNAQRAPAKLPKPPAIKPAPLTSVFRNVRPARMKP